MQIPRRCSSSEPTTTTTTTTTTALRDAERLDYRSRRRRFANFFFFGGGGEEGRGRNKETGSSARLTDQLRYRGSRSFPSPIPQRESYRASRRASREWLRLLRSCSRGRKSRPREPPGRRARERGSRHANAPPRDFLPLLSCPLPPPSAPPDERESTGSFCLCVAETSRMMFN